jgi:hypothetical protein
MIQPRTSSDRLLILPLPLGEGWGEGATPQVERCLERGPHTCTTSASVHNSLPRACE